MVSHRILSDSKSPQVSRTLLSILVNLNNAIVWIVSTRPQISRSSNHIINCLVTVPRTPITIGIPVTYRFHSFFGSLASFRNSSLNSLSFSFTLSSARTAKSTIGSFSFFCWLAQCLVVWPRLGDPFVSQNPRGVCASPFHYYYFFAPSKFFTPVLAGGHSLESEGQQVSSGLQDSSQYSNWWSFTGVWVTASLLRSPGLFSVF